MVDQNIINIADLRSAINRALDHAEALLGPEIDVDVDYYWHLWPKDAFDVHREPTNLTMGQLSDDLEEVHDRDDAPVLASHELQHLTGVLRALEWALAPS
jgi:hypothetical protein